MACHRILSCHLDPQDDVRGKHCFALIAEHYSSLSAKGSRDTASGFVRSASSYLIDGDLSQAQAQQLQEEVFVDPIIETGYLNSYPDFTFQYILEIGFKPGVTDNVGRSAEEAIGDVFPQLKKVSVFTSTLFFVHLSPSLPNLQGKWLKDIFANHYYNELIERCEIINWATWPQRQFSNTPPVFPAGASPQWQYLDLSGKDEKELLRLSEARVLSLSLEELKAIKQHYQQKEVIAQRQGVGLANAPTDVELEALAQTWSEHCKHKIFSATIEYHEYHEYHEHQEGDQGGQGDPLLIHSLYKTYIQQATKNCKRQDLLSVFTDNAGIFKFDEKHAICLKAETHNSPSALDPYGGAMTGIVGVNRDIIGAGMGAKPIFNTDVFCFAPPDWDKELPPRLMHPGRIFTGVHRGVKDGGNESGIPTINGAMAFEDRFLGKPLVFCGTGGLIPLTVREKPSHQKGAHPGDLIVMVGGRIGKDGIHGATFSFCFSNHLFPHLGGANWRPHHSKKNARFFIRS